MAELLSFAAVAVIFTIYTHQRHHDLELDEEEHEQVRLLEEKWDYNASLEKFVRWAPKVELHVHFDGSFDPTMIYQHLLENGTIRCLPVSSTLPWDQSHYPVRQLVQECQNERDFHSICSCRGKRSLHEMLKAFEIFLPLVRGNLELLEALAMDFCKRQAQQHVVYTEMRYSPHLLAEGGSLAQETNEPINADPVVDAVTRGLRRGEQEYGVKVNQILCCITWRPDWADDVVRLAHERRNDAPCAVVGVDIAAGEEHFDPTTYPHLYHPHKRAMERARELDIPITLHAGESAGDESIRAAIHDFGARRIGHGYRMSPDMMKLCQERGVHVEVCPTSSVETGGWVYDDESTKNWKDHPGVHMLRRGGLTMSLNSDDPSVFDTSLTWQWRIALGKMGITLDELKATTRHAIDAAFLSDVEKERLHDLVEKHLPHRQPMLLQTHSFSDRVSGVNQTNMENC